MKTYKDILFDLLLKTHALYFADNIIMTSGRPSPYFFNAGGLLSGKSISAVGAAGAELIEEYIRKHDIPAEFNLGTISTKGPPLAAEIAAKLHELYNIEVELFFDRQKAKGHGEATIGISKLDEFLYSTWKYIYSLLGREYIRYYKDYKLNAKQWIVGTAPKVGPNIEENTKFFIFDDVFTTGETKEKFLRFLGKCSEYPKNLYNSIIAIVVVLDRWERGGGASLDSLTKESAIEAFKRKYNIDVISIFNAGDIINGLVARNQKTNAQDMVYQLDRYGTDEATDWLEKNAERLDLV